MNQVDRQPHGVNTYQRLFLFAWPMVFALGCHEPLPEETPVATNGSDASASAPTEIVGGDRKTDLATQVDGSNERTSWTGARDAGTDAASYLALPPEAGVRDLAEEACPARRCLISDHCYRQGEVNPLNDCQWCNPANSRGQWSPLEDGAYCDDRLWCTANDRCQLGHCSGTTRCEEHEFCSELDRSCLPR